MQLWNKTTKALLALFIIVLLSVFLFGVIIFNWYTSTDDFNRHVESLRSRLKDRGIKLGNIDTGPLGQIEISDFSVDLGDLGKLSVAKLSGRIEILSLMSGKFRTTFNVTEIIRQFVAKKFRKRFAIAPEAEVSFAFEGDPRNLNSMRSISGEIDLSEIKLKDIITGLDIEIPAGKLPVKSPGPVISFPDLPVRFLDRDFTLKGSIRNVLRNPEFVDTTLAAKAQQVRKMAQKVIDSFNDKEISRKVGMEGPANVDILVNGPVLAPETRVDFNVPGYKLQFRGEYREIMTTYDHIKGSVMWSGDLKHPRIEATISAGKLTFDYFELRRSHLPHLYFRAKEGAAKITYFDHQLKFEQLALNAYDGQVAAQLNINLNRKPVHFDFRVIANTLDLHKLLGDVFNMHNFLGGKTTFLFEGYSKTLLLERIVAEGKVNIQNLHLVGFPDKDRLLLPTVLKVLPGTKYGNSNFDVKLDHAYLDIMKIKGEGPAGIMAGFVNYNILTLKIEAGLGLDLSSSLLTKHPALKQELPKGRLDMTLQGRIIDPHITYTPAAVYPNAR